MKRYPCLKLNKLGKIKNCNQEEKCNICWNKTLEWETGWYLKKESSVEIQKCLVARKRSITSNVNLCDSKIKELEGITCKERNRVSNCLMEFEALGVLATFLGSVKKFHRLLSEFICVYTADTTDPSLFRKMNKKFISHLTFILM